ncbi:Nrg1-like zn-finger transcription factor [Mycena venus]|uniref:Nrg1-like zn-finger transcription factor n=1 Tax=Mycena venus TaxID=2733690 RepID=A0A8H7D6K2_9AGAR|nr:Nrg1-like zn-finger transcription factor [Mycena venus]
MSHSTSTSAKKGHACRHCDQVCSTSSHLARHSRIHTGQKEFKCNYPGCEKRSSRQDNLRAHQRIHSAQPRPKAPKKSKVTSHSSPVSSSSSFSSPEIPYQPSSPELYNNNVPAADYNCNGMPASNSLQLFFTPQQLPQPQEGFVADARFNNLSLPPSLAHSRVTQVAHPYPRLSRSMPPPGVRDDSLDNGFNSGTMYTPQRRGSSDLYQPRPTYPAPAPARSTYPYATYPPSSAPEFPVFHQSWYN